MARRRTRLRRAEDDELAMHELSICGSIARLAQEHADGRRVIAVHLDVGHLRQVVPDTLRSSWEFVVDDTALAGSQLIVNYIPAVIHCHGCDASTTLTAPVFRCPCGSIDTHVTAGEELSIRSLDLARPD